MYFPIVRTTNQSDPLVNKDTVSDSVKDKKYHLQKIISLVDFINDDHIGATKTQETFQSLRIKKHYVQTLYGRTTGSK